IMPALAAGRLVLFGETSPAGAVRLFQLRPSLRAQMEGCRLQPMSEDEAAALALVMAPLIERYLKLRLGRDASGTALELAQHYLGSGQLPGALIELVKRSASRALATRAAALEPDHVLATLSQITGLPRSILDDGERIELRTVRQFFSGR